MLEKPALKDETVVTCLRTEFGLHVSEITFLPLGADLNTAVYRVVADEETPYFVKLRRGDFDKATVAVPKCLSELGVKQVIPSLPTLAGQLWASLPPYKMILYPFVTGHHGFEVNLTDQQRVEFGATLRKLHTANIPASITNGVPREIFSPQWHQTARRFLAQIENEAFADPIAVEAATFVRAKRDDVLALIKRAERCAKGLQTQLPEFVLCHGDCHAWNLLIDSNNALYLVDWDTLIFAPKERDLMFVGGGLGGNGHTLQEEELLFYQGYGQIQVDPIAMAYYRYERIIEDIAVFCEQIFLSAEGGDDRKQALDYLKANFLPNNTIEIACRSDTTALV
jgi:spectinomycin phosphotransferase